MDNDIFKYKLNAIRKVQYYKWYILRTNIIEDITKLYTSLYLSKFYFINNYYMFLIYFEGHLCFKVAFSIY